MKWNIFERRNAKKIKEHTSPLDVEAMWQSVLPEIHPKKNRPSTFLWVFTLLTIGCVGLSYLLFQPTKINLISSNQETIAPKIVELHNLNTEEQNLVNEDAEEKLTIPSHLDKVATPLSVTKTKNNILQQPKTINNLSPIRDEFTSKGVPKVSEKKFFNNINLGKRPSQLDYNQESKNARLLVFKENIATTKFKAISSIAFLKLKIFDESQKEFKGLKLNHQKIVIDKNTTNKKPNFQFGFNLVSGLGFINKDLSTDSDLSSDFTDLKEKSETSLETFNLALALKVRHSSNFYFTSGIAYKRINERLNIRDTYTLTGTDQNAITEIYTDQNGQQFVSNGPAKKESTLALDIVHFNSHEILSLPLSIGYQFNLNALKVSPEVGININFHNTSKGRTLSGKFIEDLINVSNTDYYKKDLGVSYVAALNFNYSISSRYEIGLAPFYEYFPNSFTISSASISEFYERYGINLNLGYRF